MTSVKFEKKVAVRKVTSAFCLLVMANESFYLGR
jgi:hypothetical protein